MDKNLIPFNKPYLTGKEMHYIYQAVYSGKISGNGMFSKKCHSFFEETFNFKKVLLTTSCTDALEMCAILLDIKEGDEVIVPSYTFVSTALAFVRQGAKIVFADSRADHTGIDEKKIRGLITKKTRAIVVVHYAGVSCDMDILMSLSHEFNIPIIEDAAQAIDSYYKGLPLGGIGHLATFSFHETKNINSGEGGLLVINDEKYVKRSEIIWEKGTNRAEFFRGEINKYGWVDLGSSFLPSEILAAYLCAQLENLKSIQSKRINIYNQYYEALKDWAAQHNVKLPYIPNYATNNAHMFYLVFNSHQARTRMIEHLKSNNIQAVFHYLPLHLSDYYKEKYIGSELPISVYYAEHLLRLPLYNELTIDDVRRICSVVRECQI